MTANCYFGRFDFDDYRVVQSLVGMVVGVRECYWINLGESSYIFMLKMNLRQRQCSQIRIKVTEKLIIARWKVSDGDTDSGEQCSEKKTNRN